MSQDLSSRELLVSRACTAAAWGEGDEGGVGDREKRREEEEEDVFAWNRLQSVEQEASSVDISCITEETLSFRRVRAVYDCCGCELV